MSNKTNNEMATSLVILSGGGAAGNYTVDGELISLVLAPLIAARLIRTPD